VITALTPFVLEKRESPIKILSTSDWHLGHRRVSTYNLCMRLQTYLFPQLKTTHLLNIGGDVWDTLLSLCEDTNIIEAFLIDLMRECDKYGVVVRVLLGTYSHDRSQSSLFPILHDRCGFTNDLRYIDRVYLEEIKSLNLRILYLPDDLPYESSYDCMKQVEDLMDAQGWTYVDYVFGHGYFDHMLPTHIPRKPKCTFLVDQFKDIVRRYVCMGHIHQCDYRENVFYNNSFDRLAHGEEDPKGFMSIIDHGDTAHLEFIENKEATKFYTIDLSGYSDKDEIGKIYIDKVTQLFNGEHGHVRVVHPSSEIRVALQRITSSRFPKLAYSFKKVTETQVRDTSQTHQKLLDIKSYPVPSEETLPAMVFDFLSKEKTTLSRERIAEILAA
jgi:DNA repair exonuclease SbcCD nuclease subunit